jgi:branched-chain amino acid transport system substrate-binding protein
MGVKFVVGHYNSTSSIFAAPIYAKAGVLMISPSTTNPLFTDAGLWNTFRTSGRDDVQGTFAGEYVAKNFPGQKIAVLHDGTPYGKGLAEKTKASLNAAGIKETIFSTARFKGKGLSTLVDKLKSQNIEVVYFGGLAEELGALIRKSSAAGLEMQFVTGDGAAVGGLAVAAGGGLEGTLMTFSLQDQARPNVQGIVERLRAKGVDPIAYALKSYAAVQVIAKGAEIAKSNDPRAISSALRSGKAVPTILGELSFDEKGDRREPDVAMYKWQRQPSGNWGFYSMD